MSCRTSAQGSVATTFVQRLYGLPDSQCTSLFHILRRQYETASPGRQAGARLAAQAQYPDEVSSMRETVTVSRAWTPALRARALARMDRLTGNPPEPAIAHAFVNMRSAAEQVADTNAVYFHQVAADTGLTSEHVAAEYARLIREYTPQMRTQVSRMPDAQSIVAPNTDRVYPDDLATRYAVNVIHGNLRCAHCGQFRTMDFHTCPEGGTTSPPRRRRNPRRVVLPEDTPAPPDVSAAPDATSASGPREPVPMDTFQDEYDAARAAISNGEPVPTDLAAEQAGTVTGGLGARDGGNSFGIEIEIDFPDDPYPYRARQLFARRLYREGITTSPQVERWHSVGDEAASRPGGTYQQSSGNWVCEFDRSVDDVSGDRGVEIKSQIMFDEPETWANLRKIMEVSEEFGGRATARTGLHINIGAQQFPIADVERPLQLLRIGAAYDDVTIRLANNPAADGNNHRGRAYCTPVIDEYEQRQTVDNALSGYRNAAMHRHMWNMSHLSNRHQRTHSTDSRVEGRGFDGVATTADIGRIQAAITLHLAFVKAAQDLRDPGQDAQTAGTMRSRFGRRRLSGQDWTDSTLPMRNMMAMLDETSPNPLFRKQVVHMFAVSRWQSNNFHNYHDDDDDDEDY